MLTTDMPICLTWEQFAPPYKEIPGVLFGGKGQAVFARRIRPVGDGEPLCGPYRLHEGRFSQDDARHEAAVHENEFALVVTLSGERVAAMSGITLWVHEEHRRSKVPYDIAAEMWLEHARRRDWTKWNQKHSRAGEPVPMIKSTIKVGMRAYLLAIERGYVYPPEGYVIPTL